MSFFKEVDKLIVGENVYHFIFGKGKYIGEFTKEKSSYLEVDFEDYGRKVFLVETYGKIIANDPLIVLKTFFDDYKNQKILKEEICYFNPFFGEKDESDNSFARRQYLYPIIHRVTDPDEYTLKVLRASLNDDYPELPFETEEIFARNNFFNLKINYMDFFPILHKWISKSEVIEIIGKDIDNARFFPSFSFEKGRDDIHYFWGKELAIPSSFYQAKEGMYPDFFLEKIDFYSEDEKSMIKEYAEVLSKYRSSLEEIMKTYQLEGIVLKDENRALILDYDREKEIYKLVNEKYTKILEEIEKEKRGLTESSIVSYRYSESPHELVPEYFEPHSHLKIEKNILSIADPFFVRFSFQEDKKWDDTSIESKYITKFKEYEDPKNGIIFWGSEEASDFYRTRRMKSLQSGHKKDVKERYFRFSFAEKNLTEFVNCEIGNQVFSKILSLKDSGQLFDIIETMDPYQYEIVTQKLQNMIVIGKAGTGKTAVLQTRVAYFLTKEENKMENILLLSNSNQLVSDTKSVLSGMSIENANNGNICSIYYYFCKLLQNKINGSKISDWEENSDMYAFYSDEKKDKNMYLEILKSSFDFFNKKLDKAIENKIIQYKANILLPSAEEELLEQYNGKICKFFGLKEAKKVEEVIRSIKENKALNNAIYYFEVVSNQVSLKLAKQAIDNPSLYIRTYKDARIEDAKMLKEDGLFYYLIFGVVDKDEKLKTIFTPKIFKPKKKSSVKASAEEKEDGYYINKNEERKPLKNIQNIFDVLIFALAKFKGLLGETRGVIKELAYLYYFYNQYNNARQRAQTIEFNDLLKFYKKKNNLNSLNLFSLVSCLDNMDEIEDRMIKTVYIDEYENLSASVIEFLMGAFPNATFELYGDLAQKIYDHTIFNDFSFARYQLKINYRSSLSVLERLKEKFGIEYSEDELPYYPKQGKVTEMSVKEYLNETRVSLFGPHRIAVICKKEYLSEVKELLLQKYYEKEIIELDLNDTIKRRKIALCSVERVAGLEFEEVFVFEKGMNKSEKYVAESRALENLTVILD